MNIKGCGRSHCLLWAGFIAQGWGYRLLWQRCLVQGVARVAMGGVNIEGRGYGLLWAWPLPAVGGASVGMTLPRGGVIRHADRLGFWHRGVVTVVGGAYTIRWGCRLLWTELLVQGVATGCCWQDC